MRDLDTEYLASEYSRILRRTGLVSTWEKQSASSDTVIFEGAQGVLLDETWGFSPYNTWTDCTFGNADKLIGGSLDRSDILKVGVLRSYFTRHGAGPFPTESKFPISEPHNETEQFMGSFRVGHFDAVLAHYALQCCPVDAIAITHMDRIPSQKVCHAYGNWDGKFNASSLNKVRPIYRSSANLAEEIGMAAWVESYGPAAKDKRPSERLRMSA